MSKKVDVRDIDLEDLESLEEVDAYIGGKVYGNQPKVSKMKEDDDAYERKSKKTSFGNH